MASTRRFSLNGKSAMVPDQQVLRSAQDDNFSFVAF
jgi:hypothetical protein